MSKLKSNVQELYCVKLCVCKNGDWNHITTETNQSF